MVIKESSKTWLLIHLQPEPRLHLQTPNFLPRFLDSTAFVLVSALGFPFQVWSEMTMG